MVEHADNAMPGTLAWWAAVLFCGEGLTLLLVFAGTLGVAVLVGRAAVNLRGPSPAGPNDIGWIKRGVARLRGDQGVATVEFVLVFPIALLTMLVLLQTTLMMGGNLFVNYAAFAAARTAIVRAPTGQPGGGGVMTQGGDSEAWRAVERSAAIAMAPVSGQLDTGTEGARLTTGLTAMFEDLGSTPPRWVETLAGARLNYALAHTNTTLYFTRVRRGGVELVEVGDGGTIYYDPKSPVTVGVSHRLHLSIPYASVLFSDGMHPTSGGSSPYADVTATSTLTLEGYDRNLPGVPEVDRDP